MNWLDELPFKEIWLVDFEFAAAEGDNPSVICMVALEVRSGRRIRAWQHELAAMRVAPFNTGEGSLLVAYYASAEMSCFLSLGWELPDHVLDLFTEFRNHTNGLSTPCGAGLLGALAYFGLDSASSAEKESMRALAMRGGPWTSGERGALLDYCESDVRALEKLLPRMLSSIALGPALLRGRYMKAVARMEFNGVPIDEPLLDELRERWGDIQDRLISVIDADYGVFEGRSFRAQRFAHWLIDQEIPWPRHPSGRLDLSDDVFREMGRTYPAVSPLRELRVALSQMRLAELPVGSDGRNRCLLSAFRSRTGRNQPSNKKFIFGPSVWLRGLIRPRDGFGLAYVDWSQQEFGIAAALSRDPLMQEAYSSGDPYLAFAKQAGAAPLDATKQSHKSTREQFKACVLAVQYGMGADSLASRIGQPPIRARELLALHRRTYRVFWEWSEAAVDHAMLHGTLWSVFDWRIHTGSNPNPRFLCNFPMQANGAEMLRLACCLATEAGIRVCAPVHDALLIEAPLEGLDDAVAHTQELMQAASEVVLSGFALRSDAELVRSPDRYMDERGLGMWNQVTEILAALNESEGAHL